MISRLKVAVHNPLSVSHVPRSKALWRSSLKRPHCQNHQSFTQRANDKGHKPLDNKKHLEEISSYSKAVSLKFKSHPKTCITTFIKAKYELRTRAPILCLSLVICTSQTEALTTNNTFLFLNVALRLHA